MSLVPDLADFRNTVDRVPQRLSRNATLIKVGYLTAARASEVITQISPADVGHTKPYGTYMKWDLADYEAQKVLVLKIAILKRKTDEVLLKNIGLPCDPKFEPWTLDLLRYIKKTGKICFDFTRQRERQIIKDYFPYPEEIKKKRKNILRHFRLTHLANDYGFNAEDIITYAGWTFKGLFKSGQLDTYLHLDWRKYFKKLLKPLRT